MLAEYIDTDELEQIAECFDNIREMRKTNKKMVGNNDEELGNQFDEQLTFVITQMTEQLQKASGSNKKIERDKAVIGGKRNLMILLLDKTLDYLKQCDP